MPVQFAAAVEHLDTYITDHMHYHNTPAVSLAVTDRERTLRIATHGFANLDARTPVTPEHLFEIGSISKSFAALITMQLVEEGALDLHAPIATYLPWFEVKSRHAPITLHHVLSHTSGLIEGSLAYPDAPSEVWALRETETGCPPGDFYHYSNDAYQALGLLLTNVTGTSFGPLLKERILDRIGMYASEPVIIHAMRPRLAVGYEPMFGDRPYHPSQPLAPATWLESESADGSIAATPADMAAYLRVLLNRGRGVVSEASFAQMITPVADRPENLPLSQYGYGLAIGNVDGHRYIGHGGSMVGYLCYLLCDLDAGFGAMVMTSGPGMSSEIATYAVRLFCAAQDGSDLPAPPELPERARIPNAAEYAGVYRGPDDELTLVADGETLFLDHAGERVQLEAAPRIPDAFHVNHPDFALQLLTFGRQEGRVVEAFHGSRWFTNAAHSGPTTFDYPPEWEQIPGHYRSHNPWMTGFRVVLRKGALLAVYPFGWEEPLVPLPDGSFRVGADERLPERLRFFDVAAGRALRARLSNWDYYRFFTA